MIIIRVIDSDYVDCDQENILITIFMMRVMIMMKIMKMTMNKIRDNLHDSNDGNKSK